MNDVFVLRSAVSLYAGRAAATTAEVALQMARNGELPCAVSSLTLRVAVLAPEADPAGEHADPPLDVAAAVPDMDVLARCFVEADVEPAAPTELRRDLVVAEGRPADKGYVQGGRVSLEDEQPTRLPAARRRRPPSARGAATARAARARTGPRLPLPCTSKRTV